MRQKNIILLTIIGSLLAGLIGWQIYASGQPGKYDSFAVCLKDNGATFYGAFWCSHCQSQKKLFGQSAKYLNYIECSSPDGRSQLPICSDKNIQSYPTWEFSDQSRQTGEISLADLSTKTNCPLP